MKIKTDFVDLKVEIPPLQEDSEGYLVGGFVVGNNSNAPAGSGLPSNTNTNNTLFCSCSCSLTNQDCDNILNCTTTENTTEDTTNDSANGIYNANGLLLSGLF